LHFEEGINDGIHGRKTQQMEKKEIQRDEEKREKSVRYS